MVSHPKLALRVLDDGQIRQIHWATLDVLEHTGVRLTHPVARELLHGAGAYVEGELVRFPAWLVEDAIRTAPSKVTLYDRSGQPATHLEGRRAYFGSVVDSPHIVDPLTGQLRPVVAEDIATMTRLADYCPNIDFVSAWGGSATDYPPEVRNQVACRLVLENTTKPFGTNAHDARCLADIHEMVAIVSGGKESLRRRPLTYHYSEPTSPLVHTDDAVEKLLLCADDGVPLVYTPMTMAGATGPATLAGTLVISNADCLSGLVIHQLRRRGAPFIHGGMPSVMDMGALTFAFGAPEFALAAAALVELGHFYSLPTYGTAGAADAKVVDVQAAVEFAVSDLMAALSGANLIHDVALIGSCRVVAPEAVVLNDEIIGLVRTILRGIAVDAETLATDLIHRVGPGGHYLGEEHTRTHFRSTWFPGLFDRQSCEVWLESQGVAAGEALNRRTRELMERHRAPELPLTVVRDLADLERRWLPI